MIYEWFIPKRVVDCKDKASKEECDSFQSSGLCKDATAPFRLLCQKTCGTCNFGKRSSHYQLQVNILLLNLT